MGEIGVCQIWMRNSKTSRPNGHAFPVMMIKEIIIPGNWLKYPAKRVVLGAFGKFFVFRRPTKNRIAKYKRGTIMDKYPSVSSSGVNKIKSIWSKSSSIASFNGVSACLYM